MLAIVLMSALGIFAVGVAVGIVAVVSYGIHREERRFQRTRRFREEHDLWAPPGESEHYLEDEAPDRVSWAARRLNGLYVRHPQPSQDDGRRWPSRDRYDVDLGNRA